MRVIAGTARSLRLKMPEGSDIRPTTDRIKETLFNILQYSLFEAVFVDLFSGSGGIGIEALSRGAKRAWFVDNNRNALSCIRENLQFTHFTESAAVLGMDVFSAIPAIHENHADIIFMDPPYKAGYEERVLNTLKAAPYVTKDTVIVIEASLNTDFSWLKDTGYCLDREKRYKTNKHVFCHIDEK